MQPPPTPTPTRRPARSLSFLVILGMFLLLTYGATIFAQAIGVRMMQVTMELALSEQLNAATFLARELAAEAQAIGGNELSASRPAGPLSEAEAVSVYDRTFQNFATRHGLNAQVLDSESGTTLLGSDYELTLGSRFTLWPPGDYLAAETLGEATLARRKLQGRIHQPDGVYIGSLVPIAGTTHTVAVFRPQADIIEAARLLSRRLTGYLLCVFAMVLALFVMFIRSVTRPLVELTAAATALGQGQFDQQVEVHSVTEVGTLAEAFNRMSRELREKYRELAETTGRLEESNRRYRAVVRESERQKTELEITNNIVWAATSRSEQPCDLAGVATRIQAGFGLQLVAIFLLEARAGWALEAASDPTFFAQDFATAELYAELERLRAHRKVRLGSSAWLGLDGADSVCLVPVVVDGDLEAAFVLVAAGHGTFPGRLVERFRNLTHQLGLILHKDALLSETLTRREQLEQVNRVGQALTSELEFNRLIPRVLIDLNAFLRADQAVLMLTDPAGELQPVIAVDRCGTIPLHFHTSAKLWNQRVLLEQQPVRIDEAGTIAPWGPDGKPLPHARISRFQSYVGLPLHESGRVVGVLGFFAEERARFNDDHIRFLSALASQLSGAILNTRLFDELSRRDARRNHELSTAKKFQADRIPTSFEEGTLEARVSLFPAVELAGDFFDVYRLSPNITGLVIGDVASKGVAASLQTFSMLSIFRNLASSMAPPAKVMEQANETTLAQLKEDFWFVTAFYARINQANHTITYCKAGHVLPVLYREATGTCDYLDGDGLPLGIKEGAEYIGAQTAFEPGDRLILYTDGVTELKNIDGEQFGLERLTQVIAAYGSFSAEEIRGAIIAALDDFIAPGASRDDILLAVVALNRDPWVARELRYTEMDNLVAEVFDAIGDYPLDSSCLYSIRLAINEAMANAYDHGHLGQADLPIQVAYRVSESYFALTVKDRGPGFDYENLPDPTIPENLILSHGRGIFLMRQLMDEIEFNEGGNEIRLRKYFTFTGGRKPIAPRPMRPRNLLNSTMMTPMRKFDPRHPQHEAQDRLRALAPGDE